jgi:2-amino-4-hydroxy-6-hydroxymethyldihydropteridine diphosphokinase
MPFKVVEQVYLAMGSNLKKRLECLDEALCRLQEAFPGCIAPSSVYETPPLGPVPQGPYLNQCVTLATDKTPETLLTLCKKIEWDLGRRPGQRWGPRPIDIDILLIGNKLIHTPELTVPHPEMTNRQFVLFPLSDIAPFFKLPHTGSTPLFHLSALILANGMDKIRMVRFQRREYHESAC